MPVHLDIDDASTSAVVAAQYALVSRLLTNDLATVIEDCNKTAHAQWRWHLNSKETAFVGAAPEPLNYSALFAH